MKHLAYKFPDRGRLDAFAKRCVDRGFTVNGILPVALEIEIVKADNTALTVFEEDVVKNAAELFGGKGLKK
jgi:hypothetical protein